MILIQTRLKYVNRLKDLNIICFNIFALFSIPVITYCLITSCSNSNKETQNRDIPTDGYMYDTKHRIPFNEEREIMSYDGNATILEIPEYFESSKYGKVQIKKIGANAFYSLVEIEYNAFLLSELTKLTLSNSFSPNYLIKGGIKINL